MLSFRIDGASEEEITLL
jgi:hypothetical protein